MRLYGNKSKKKHSAKRRSRTAAIICSVLGVVLLTVAAYRIWEKPPAHDESGLSQPAVSAAPDAAGSDAPDTSPDGQAADAGAHNDAVYTFLVVGRDKVGANTDTILVGSLNTDTHAINIVSIPRDTLVNISCNVKKVNVLYEYDLNNGGNGVDGLLSGIRDLIGFNVDFYAVVDLEAFVKLVDTIGGVYYDVPVDMYYDDPTQDLHIAIPAGYQWLDGENALKVVRFRKGYANADIGRIGTQQDFLKAVAKQMLKLGNIPNLTKLSDIFTQYVDTDLTSANISFLARQFLLCKADDINFYTLPGNYGDSIGGFSYVSLDLDQWLEMVNTYLNPWDKAVTVDNVNILTRENGVLTATTGVIAGGADSFLTMQEYLASIGVSSGGGKSSAAATPAPTVVPESTDNPETPDSTAAPEPAESPETPADTASPETPDSAAATPGTDAAAAADPAA